MAVTASSEPVRYGGAVGDVAVGPIFCFEDNNPLNTWGTAPDGAARRPYSLAVGAGGINTIGDVSAATAHITTLTVGTVQVTSLTVVNGLTVQAGGITVTGNSTITGTLGSVVSYNGLVVTPNTGVITTGTWHGTAIDHAYLSGIAAADVAAGTFPGASYSFGSGIVSIGSYNSLYVLSTATGNLAVQAGRYVEWNASIGQSASRAWGFINDNAAYGLLQLYRSNTATDMTGVEVMRFNNDSSADFLSHAVAMGALTATGQTIIGSALQIQEIWYDATPTFAWGWGFPASTQLAWYYKTGGSWSGQLMRLDNTGALNLAGALTATTGKFSTLGAFAVGDKYVIADAAGNLHISSLGPVS